MCVCGVLIVVAVAGAATAAAVVPVLTPTWQVSLGHSHNTAECAGLLLSLLFSQGVRCVCVTALALTHV